jgi:hypothetical protein
MIIFDGKQSVQVRCLAGCAQDELIGALKASGLWERGGDETVCTTARQHGAVGTVSHEIKMCERARRVFDDALLCLGTIGERYLEGREIWGVARAIEDVRFHPQCPRERGVQPAIVVAMRDLSRSIQAVQRIYLVESLHGTVMKAGAMMLGPVSRAWMQLMPLIHTDTELHIAEGCETALSVMAMDYRPVWALGSCGAIERFGVIDGIDRLVIWADHDAPGQRAAELCSDRWITAGRRCVIRTPNREGWDFADVWRARNARQ